ncbi:SsrA-binding protein SmpB [Anaplasmataceae bacterium AB001_6]|nr:SsrA-binding protein SmpB [Anaplasmataceae bacterium AB001_6]
MTVFSYNKKIGFNYELKNSIEAGICLKGSEVKSIKKNSVNISNAYIYEKNEELFIKNLYIKKYQFSSDACNHIPERERKILIKKKDILKMIGKIKEKNLTIVPKKIYSNPKGLIKIEICLAKGKNKRDKREEKKQKEWNIRKDKIMKNL